MSCSATGVLEWPCIWSGALSLLGCRQTVEWARRRTNLGLAGFGMPWQDPQEAWTSLRWAWLAAGWVLTGLISQWLTARGWLGADGGPSAQA